VPGRSNGRFSNRRFETVEQESGFGGNEQIGHVGAPQSYSNERQERLLFRPTYVVCEAFACGSEGRASRLNSARTSCTPEYLPPY